MLLKRTLMISFVGLAWACVDDNPENGVGLPSGTEVPDAQSSSGGEGRDSGTMADAALDTGMNGGQMTDSGRVPAEGCDDLCEGFLECAEQACPDQSSLLLRSSCRSVCMEEPSILSEANALESCGELVDFLSERSLVIGERCSPNGGLCDIFADVTAGCLTERCPNAAELGPGREFFFKSICTEQTASGAYTQDALGSVEENGCGHFLVSGLLEYFLVESNLMGSGSLAQLCTAGPVSPADVCSPACRQLGECIPAGTPDDQGGFFADYPTCRWICAASPDFRPVTWRCISESNTCQEAFGCFTVEPPSVPACGPFGQRVAECLIAECPNAGPVNGGTAGVATSICNDLVDRSVLSIERVEASTGGACSEPEVAGTVDFLRRVNPQAEGSGFLAELCNEGPANPLTTCTPACETFGRCIEEDSERAVLRERTLCELFCSIQAPGLEVEDWDCVGGVEQCDDLASCD